MFTILFLCVGMLTSSVAQSIEARELRFVKGAESEAFHPTFTPDGKTILLSGEDCEGLKTSAITAGRVKPAVSPPGNQIAFHTTEGEFVYNGNQY